MAPRMSAAERFPWATILPFEGKDPQIHETAFVAPGARIIGDVTIGPEASVWYNCVLRGDIHRIEVGARSNVQDGSVFHVEGPRPDTDGSPTIVGEDCVIGHMAVVHGAVLEDRAFVGMGAVAMDDCRIGEGAMLGGGRAAQPRQAHPAARDLGRPPGEVPAHPGRGASREDPLPDRALLPAGAALAMLRARAKLRSRGCDPRAGRARRLRCVHRRDDR